MDNLDFISKEKNFYFNGKRTISTPLGVALSFILIIISLVILVQFIIFDYFNSSELNIKRFTASGIEGWESLNINVMIKTPKIYNSSFDSYVQINDANTQFFNKDPKFICNKDQIGIFLNETEVDENHLYFCIDITKFTRWSFKMRCFHNRTGVWNNCTDDTTKAYFRYQRIKLGKTAELVNESIVYENFYNTLIRTFYNFNQFYIDNGILFEQPEMKYFGEMVHFENLTNQNWINKGNWIVAYYLEVQSTYNHVIKVESNRLSTVFANSMGIIKLSAFFLFFINKILEPFYYKRAVLIEIKNKKFLLNEFSFYFTDKDQETHRIKFIIENYNLSNYIRVKLFRSKADEYSLFKHIDNYINSIVSLENLLGNIPKELNKPSDNCLANFDFLGESPRIYINKDSKFKTKTGGFITIIILLFIPGIIFLFGYDFIYNKNPFINLEDKNIKLLNETSPPDVPAVLGLSKSLSEITKLVYFTDKQIYPYKDLNASLCTIKELESFNITQSDSYLTYWCFNYKTVLSDVYQNIRSNKKAITFIYLANCTELPEYNIELGSCKLNATGPVFNTKVDFYYYTKTNIFNQDKYEDYIEEKINTWKYSPNYTLIDKFQQKELRHTINPLIIHNDNSKLFNSPLNTIIIMHNSYLMKNIPESNIPLKTGIPERYFLISIILNESYTEVDRVYLKLDEFLAQILSIFLVLLIIFRIINNFISEYLFLNYFKNSFVNSLDVHNLEYIQGPKKLDKSLDKCNLVIHKDIKKEIVKVEEIINFRNFLLNNQNMKRLGSVFKDYISLNHIIKRENKLLKESRKEILIEKMDLFGRSNFLYINNSPSFRNSIGGFISITYIFLVISFIIFFGINFWSGRKVRVNNILSYYEVKDSTDPNIYSILSGPKNHTNKYTYIWLYNSKSGLINECTSDEYYMFYNTPPDSSRTYYCVNNKNGLKSNLQNGYDKIYNIRYISCKSLAGSNRSPEYINWIASCNKTIDSRETYKLDFKLLYTDIDEETLERKNSSFSDSQTNFNSSFKLLTVTLKNKIIIDNVNRFGYKEKNESSYILDNYQYSISYSDYRLWININDNQQYQLKLVYNTLEETIARVIAMINTLNLLVIIIHKYTSKYKYYEYVLNTAIIIKTDKGIQKYNIEQEYYSDFNFCNYVLSSIPLLRICSGGVKRYRFLESKLVSILSMENLLNLNKTDELEMGQKISII